MAIAVDDGILIAAALMRGVARLAVAAQQMSDAAAAAKAAGLPDITEEQVDDAILFALAQRAIAIGKGTDPTPGLNDLMLRLLASNDPKPAQAAS